MIMHFIVKINLSVFREKYLFPVLHTLRMSIPCKFIYPFSMLILKQAIYRHLKLPLYRCKAPGCGQEFTGSNTGGILKHIKVGIIF